MFFRQSFFLCIKVEKGGQNVEAKSWIAIVLVVFIIGALVWINTRNKDK